MRLISALLIWLALLSGGVLAQNAAKVTIVGAGGGAATVTGGKLDVNASVTPSGTQDVNLTKVAGASVATGHGTASGAIRVELPTDGTGVVGLTAGTNYVGTSSPRIATISTTVTRPSDTAPYAANDAFANSTSAPTTGGFTLTGACAASGGFGTIQSANVSASAGTLYQGEIWVFDQAVTATNDNSPLSVSDSDIQNLIGVIPFATTDVNAANTISYVTGLNVGYTCVGTANLRFLVKINTAITPASAEVLAVRVQVQN